MKPQPIEERLKETLEKGDRKGRLGTVADEMFHFCTHYVDPFRVPLAMDKMLRLCHRFAQICMEERTALLKEEVTQIMGTQRPVWNARIFLFGVLYGAFLTAAIAAIVIVI